MKPLQDTITALKNVLKSGKLPPNDAAILSKQIVILEALKRGALGPDALEMIREDILPVLRKHGIELGEFYPK